MANNKGWKEVRWESRKAESKLVFEYIWLQEKEKLLGEDKDKGKPAWKKAEKKGKFLL